MSTNQTPTREVAVRVFAREFNDASDTFKESDDERAPVYLLLPTGTRANRVFVVGTLTEKTDVGEENEYWQGRIVDPNGDPFFVYAGQYQPEAASVLRDIEPPSYVAVVGKPRTFETDDGTINVSIRPESITPVGAGVRDRWVVETANRTLERIEGFDPETNEYAAMAAERYDQPAENYRRMVIEALERLEGDDENLADAEQRESTIDDEAEAA